MRQLAADDPRQVGPYRIVALLGTGGMGRVYLGLDRDGRPAAVKVVRAERAYDPEFRERFAHELALAERVHGPNIPRVYAADTSGEVPWLATEYVRGTSLQHLVERTGPLPEGSAVLLARGVAQALVDVHRQGLAHRDLKPGNVMVAAEGPQVIDFGIARAMEADGPADDARIIGTPGFMAPEASRGEPSGAPADAFALGGILVHALTGRGPFGDGHPSTVLYRTNNADPDLDGVPPALSGLLAACLDKDPARRPTADRTLQALGGPLSPAPSASAWLPPRAAAEIEGATREYRAIQPEAGPGSKGRGLLVAGAAVLALGLVGGFGAWALPFGDLVAEADDSQESADGPPQREQCDPAAHLAPEFTGAAQDSPTVPASTVLVNSAFSHDGSVLAVSGNQGVALWDWESGTELALIEADRPEDHGPARFSPDDCLIGWASDAGAHVYSLETGEHTVHSGGRNLNGIAFAPDGSTLTVADYETDHEGTVYDIDMETGETTLVYEDSTSFTDVVYAPDGAHVAGTDHIDTLQVWDAETGEIVFDQFDVPSGIGSGVQLLGDGELFFAKPEGPVHYEFTGDSDEGWQFIPETEEPEGELAEFAYNPGAERLYTYYSTDPDDGTDGRTTVELFVWDHAPGAEYGTKEELGEEGIEMAELSLNLAVHPEGEVVAGFNEQDRAVTLLDPETLGELASFR